MPIFISVVRFAVTAALVQLGSSSCAGDETQLVQSANRLLVQSRQDTSTQPREEKIRLHSFTRTADEPEVDPALVPWDHPVTVDVQTPEVSQLPAATGGAGAPVVPVALDALVEQVSVGSFLETIRNLTAEQDRLEQELVLQEETALVNASSWTENIDNIQLEVTILKQRSIAKKRFVDAKAALETSLAEVVEQTNKEIAELEQEKVDAENLVQGNVTQDESLRAELDRLTSEMNDAESEKVALENLQKASVYNTTVLKKKETTLEEKEALLAKNVSQWKSRVQAESETEDRLKEKLSGMTAEHELLKEGQADSIKAYTEAIKEQEKVQKEAALQKKKDAVRADKNQAKMAKVTKAQQELAQLRDEIAEKERLAEEHVARKAELKTLIQELTAQKRELLVQNPENMKELEADITQQRSAAQQEIAEVGLSAKMDKMAVASKQRQLDAKAAEIERLEALVTDHAAGEDDLSVKVEEIDQKVAEAIKLKEDASTLNENGNVEEKELRQKIEEVRAKEAEIRKEKTNFDAFEAKLKEKQEMLKQKDTTFKATAEDIETGVVQNADTRAKLSAKKQELLKSIQAAQNAQVQLQKNIVSIDAQREGKAKQVVTLSQELETARSQKTELEEELAQNEVSVKAKADELQPVAQQQQTMRQEADEVLTQNRKQLSTIRKSIEETRQAMETASAKAVKLVAETLKAHA
eukprot:CAMPEP_0194484014 /NCGR_PEP_ID=MMETSP0253-20130528/5474_1 /TAXON_ID=2966 /ORGANISM="Noctiluca scintillans" /LENGTH=698 /DNA_ID=CAMNT_0039323759 /DNA_START=67 /DNA_END=2163 /DNA_ORIENTATION=-